ncbi:YdiK family protein [Evansella cellulosilytica]|uniref:DUF4305 domain-containing protein n=1 Tax=Evansella cellulosilytica (strain ATCC 21833 / DSM 2522 / FERM P-1141 / JCM 9156 / N-4) TaxID=649639 RepID=E6TVU4_EVAC2|nr:YdiK family protein [Evansella cellulosilytica]ADU28653.1 hypothetical protein Bcell_0367 [Evansella cellulosilytica DSM 2522]
MKNNSARFFGYFYFFIATAFVYFAIQQHNRSEGWDIWTLLLIALAAIDYMISFRYFGAANKERRKKQ